MKTKLHQDFAKLKEKSDADTSKLRRSPLTGKPLRNFDPYVHHPIVEGIKHSASPLSAALVTFFIAKYALRRGVLAQLKYMWYRRKKSSPDVSKSAASG